MRYPTLFFLCFLLMFELSSSTTLHVVPGSSLVIPCLPVHKVAKDIKWKYNGTLVVSQVKSSGSLAISEDGFYLTISQVTIANEGDYLCVISEKDMERTNTYTVEVDVPHRSAVKVLEGFTLDLECDRPSNKEYKTAALWFKETREGQRQQLNPAYNSEAVQRIEWALSNRLDRDQAILLHELIIGDSGIYHCESEDGEKFNTVELIVEAAPTAAPHSCVGFSLPWEKCQDEASRSWGAMLEESMTDFNTRIYAHLSQSQPTQNLLYSPISISAILSHLLLGARGHTRRQLESALCLPNDFLCVHSQLRTMKEKLQGSLQMASQIYHNPRLILSESFANQSLQFYDAKPVNLSANSEDNARMINRWVAKKTNNKITQLVNSVSANAELILLNAVAFSGQWTLKFDKTHNALFNKLNGDLVNVPVLFSSKYKLAMEYIPAVKAQVARFPLTGNNSLFILLPPSSTLSELQEVEGKLTDTNVREMVAHMKTSSIETVEVTLPKLNLNVQTEMKSLLRKLGLSTLFEDPNLCGLYTDHRLQLTDAHHRAFLALTEKGVEAGAATSLSFSRSFSSFSVLRSFLLLLWSDAANVPLFMGRVTEP